MFKGFVSVFFAAVLIVTASSAMAKPKKSAAKAETESSSESATTGKSSCLVTAQQAADAICRINDCHDLEIGFQGMEGSTEKFGDKKGFMSIRAVSGNGETVCVITRVVYNPKP